MSDIELCRILKKFSDDKVHAVIEFQNNDCGYPLMILASERQ